MAGCQLVALYLNTPERGLASKVSGLPVLMPGTACHCIFTEAVTLLF